MPPERSEERDAAIAAMLPFVPVTGWSMRTLTDAAGPDADLLFPGGSPDMIEAYVDGADRAMVDAAAADDMGSLRVPARVRRAIELRLRRARADKAAVSRALGVLSLPQNAVLAGRIAGRTADAIWLAAGDEATGLSWYTKRLTVTPIYAATLLYWLRDDSEDDAATLAFLDRRLAGVARIGRLRRRLRAPRL